MLHCKFVLVIKYMKHQSVATAVSEVLMKGDHSEVAMAISQNNALISEAMGVYDKNVEIMAVAPLPAAAAPAGNEVEVSV